MQKGKFIVIDGADGSGKTTQVGLLTEKLRKEKISYQLFNFPIYRSFFGKLIRRYLNGEFGDPIKTDPYLGCLPYALDRFFYKEKIKKALITKKIVITNRYVTSNLIYQGAKIKDEKKRNKFFRWAEKLEYELLKLPRPDLVIYLWIPAKISHYLILKRQKDKKSKKPDYYEKNFIYQKEVVRISKILAQKCNNWQMIKCYENKILLTKQQIAEKLWKIVKQHLTN